MDSATTYTISKISSIIGGKKHAISMHAKSSLYDLISRKPHSECLSLVLRRSDGSILRALPPSATKEYAKALILFVSKSKYDGYDIDSGLTDPCCHIVAEIFSREIEERGDEIASTLAHHLINSKTFIDSISSSFVTSLSGSIPSHIRSKVTDIITAKLKTAIIQNVDAAQAAALKGAVVKSVAASVSSPVAAKIAAILIKTLATSMKPIIIKVIASGAFKAIVISKIKAIVVGSLLGAFIKIVGAKIGLSTGAAMFIILIPVVIAWLTYEAYNFPNKLASEVSGKVSDDIENGFQEVSASIAEAIFEKAISIGASSIVSSIINDENVADFINTAISEA